MSRPHMAAIVAGTVIVAILWFFVVPLLLDLGERSGRDAALGWIVLAGATVLVGWVMFRPPRLEGHGDSARPRRRGHRNSDQRRRR